MPAPRPIAPADDAVRITVRLARRAARRAPAGRPRGRSGGWVGLVLAASSRAVLLSLSMLLVWAVAPSLWGWQGTVVMTGSMQPRLAPGDIAVARPVAPEELRLGQVLLVDDPDHPGRLRLHRLVDVQDGRLVLRGDANPADDSSTVGYADVHGVAVLRIPLLAGPAVAWAAGDTGPATVAAGGLVVLSLAALLPTGGAARPSHPPFPYPTTRPRARHRAPGRRPSAAQAVVLVAACAGVWGLLPADSASAAYRVTTSAPAGGWTATAYYTCVNAGYDGTAGSPGPARALRYHALQESTGTTSANTGSQTSADGTYVNGATFTASGPACGAGGTRAVTFNGTSQYVNTTAAVSALTTSTVQVWFRTTDGNGGRLIGLGDSNRTNGQAASTATDRTLFLTAAGNVVFGTQSSGTARTLVSPGTYRDGAWHLATAVVTASGTALYVDGQSVATGPAASASATGLYVRLAWDSLATWPGAPADSWFAGSLAHASVSSTALTAAQVQAHWRAGT